MKRKKKTKAPERASGSYEHTTVHTDFYTSTPSEKPLYQDKPMLEADQVRKTSRHQAAQGSRKETTDPREKAALHAILKSIIMILVLVITFFMLYKGIKLYEESIWIANQDMQETSPVLQEVSLIETFDIENKNARELFAERIEIWSEADRLVRSADDLLKRNNFDLAISRCQAALQLAPSHMGALERLGALFNEKKMYVESINAYAHLLSIDPSRKDLQKKLIQVLGVYGDTAALTVMARWYLEENNYDEDVQSYLAHALFVQEQYTDAIKAYERVLKDSPTDLESHGKLAASYMNIGQYGNALEELEQLRESNYRDENYYRQIAICNAQLGNSMETVQTLGKAAHLFGQNIVMGWIQDPRLDPVREDRSFQAFATRVGGEEFRLWLEKVAQSMKEDEQKDIAPQLSLPSGGNLQDDLLKPNQ